MIVIPKHILANTAIICGGGSWMAYAALSQSVDFTTQDVGYTLTGNGGAGVYGGTTTGGRIVVTTAPDSFTTQPTGFSGNYFAIERPTNVNATIYPLVTTGTGLTAGAAYLNLPTANGTMTGGSASFSFKFAAPNSLLDRYDGDSNGQQPARAIMEYRVDGGSWQTALAIQGRSVTGITLSQGMWWDDNFDGIFDDTDLQITTVATILSRTISGLTVGASLQTRIRLESGTQEEMAVDDISFTSAQFTAIPEPATYGLMGAGALAGVALVRRRKRTA